jgi:hypothetical protein
VKGRPSGRQKIEHVEILGQGRADVCVIFAKGRAIKRDPGFEQGPVGLNSLGELRIRAGN